MTPEQDLPALVAGLRELGVSPGQDLLVHSSLRQVGRVHGGAGIVLRALREVTGASATIVVPSYTEGNSRTSRSFQAATAGMSAADLASIFHPAEASA